MPSVQVGLVATAATTGAAALGWALLQPLFGLQAPTVPGAHDVRTLALAPLLAGTLAAGLVASVVFARVRVWVPAAAALVGVSCLLPALSAAPPWHRVGLAGGHLLLGAVWIGVARSSARRRPVRRLGTAVLVVLHVAALAAAAFLVVSPIEESAVAAVRADPALRVVDRDGYVALLPTGAAPSAGVVFYPGARTYPESYLPAWAPIVAATGVAVFVPSMPMGLAIFDRDAAERVFRGEPQIRTWWIGGHSIGGSAVSRYAGGRFAGLILWAAHLREPEEGVGVPVLAVTGGRDGVVRPSDVRDGLAGLPGARVVEIPGMDHGQFGAYRSIFGDGDPTITDAAAREAVAKATVEFLRATGNAATLANRSG